MILYISVGDSNVQTSAVAWRARQLGSCRAEHTKETIQRSTSADWFEPLEATQYAVAAAVQRIRPLTARLGNWPVEEGLLAQAFLVTRRRRACPASEAENSLPAREARI